MRATLETDRLVLRPIEMGDAANISKLAGIPSIARMTGSIPSPFPVLSAEIRCQIFRLHQKSAKEFAYAISIGGGELMGIVSLFRRSETEDYELGYWIGEPYWGRGYMTEACAAILKEYADCFPGKPVTAGVFEDNKASISVLQKLGFVETGTKEDYFSIARLGRAKSLGFKLPGNHVTMAREAQFA